ncbi:hypothetical protein BC830DRAFT_529459 [Chytriomyces sp. MP71]|nr:hypothetical protein BC830DRAFT_529459 [Chytriomyces sp. MP71]
MLNPSLIAGVHASAYRAELAELAARERERVWSETDSDESDELAGTATSNTAQNMDKTIVESNKTDAANAAFSSLSLRSSPSRPPLAASAGQNNPPVAHSYIRSHVATTKSSHEHSALFQTHRRTLSDAASPSLHYANLSHPNHVQLNLHLQPPSELSDTQWPDPHSLYAFPTLAPSAKPHVKRTGSMLDFRRVVSQQQYLPYATADSSWQQQHFNHPQNAQPQMYGQLSKMLTSPSDIGPDDVGTLFNFDEDNDLGLKYLGPEAPESGNKRTPSFDGGSSSSSSEANTWIGSYSDQVRKLSIYRWNTSAERAL